MRTDTIKRVLPRVDLGERVVAHRLRKGWDQPRLAEALGVRPARISQIENDAPHRNASPLLVRQLAYALDITTEELLLGDLPTRSSEKAKAVA